MTEKPQGIRCPYCGCRHMIMGINDTLKQPGFVRRYRECRYCGAVIRTKEVYDPPKSEAK